MSAVIDDEKRLDVKTSSKMYGTLKGTGKTISDAVKEVNKEN